MAVAISVKPASERVIAFRVNSVTLDSSTPEDKASYIPFATSVILLPDASDISLTSFLILLTGKISSDVSVDTCLKAVSTSLDHLKAAPPASVRGAVNFVILPPSLLIFPPKSCIFLPAADKPLAALSVKSPRDNIDFFDLSTLLLSSSTSLLASLKPLALKSQVISLTSAIYILTCPSFISLSNSSLNILFA